MALLADDVDLGRDRDLVERHQAGDPHAFDDLYRRYFSRLHRFCLRHTSDRDEAEEIAQEAFARAYAAMDRLGGERRFYPWVTVIARRICIDRHRKLSRIDLTDEPDLGTVDADLDHLFDEVDAAHVRSAMERIGERHREVLLLREAQAMSYAEIADHLDVPVTTVEALLHRARKALRREFQAVGGEGRGLWGLPLLGWLAPRLGRLRQRVDERWAEAVAVAAPVAVGAVTAAVILVPQGTDAGGGAPTDRGSAVEVVDLDPAPGAFDADESGAPTDPSAAERDDATADATGAGDPAPEPSASAGPVDLFVGPDASEGARGEAEEMPVGDDIGPVTTGLDPGEANDDVATFLDDATGVLLDPAEPNSSAGPPVGDPAPDLGPITGLGGSR